jgi:hypothetical protein
VTFGENDDDQEVSVCSLTLIVSSINRVFSSCMGLDDVFFVSSFVVLHCLLKVIFGSDDDDDSSDDDDS